MSKSEHNTSDRSIDRRTFMKTVGASAGAAAVGAAGSSPASGLLIVDDLDWAKDGLKAGLKFTPWGQAVNGTSWALGGLGDWLGGGNDSPTAGEISFHQTTTNAFQSWKRVSSVHIENQLENSQMVADIAARNAIADAWEDGKSESEASQAALDAIDDYHSIMWRNTFVSKQANALQIAYVIQTAANTTEADYSNWTDIGPTPANANYNGSGSIVDGGTQISPSTTQTDITLPNGETPTLEVVEFSVEWDNGDTWSSLLDNSFLDGYDSASGEFTFSTDQGNEFTDDFTAANLNVPDADLPSKRILNCADLADKLGRIEQNATDLKQNYDLNRVGDIYTALDNGNVTPNQIRGVAGLAEHLSGTSDASEGRYQIALSTLFDIPRPDMSQVATVTIEHSGATDIEISVDADGTRQRELTGMVEEKVYQGQLFASSISADLAVDGTYLTDPAIVAASTDNLYSISIDGSSEWSASNPFSNDLQDVAVTPKGSKIFITDGDNLAAYSGGGGQLWQISMAGSEIVSPTESYLFVGDKSGNVKKIDATNGEVVWTNSYGTVIWEFLIYDSHLYIGADNSTIYKTDFEGNTVSTISTGRSDTKGISISPNGEFLVSVSDSGGAFNGDWDTVIEKISLGDSTSVEWSNSFSPKAGDVIVTDTRIIHSNGDETIALTHDNTQKWTASYQDAELRKARDGSGVLIAGTQKTTIDKVDESGNVLWSMSNPSGYIRGLDISGENKQYDGFIQDAQFAAATENGMSQLYLSGETKILEMQDADGNSVDNVKTEDFGSPEYDNADISQWAEYMKKISEEQADALDELADSDPIFGGGGFGGINIPTLPGFGLIESVVIVGVGYLGLSAVNS